MVNILGKLAKSKTDINDRIISDNLIASTVASSQAYLNAVSTCATPELRSIYLTNLNLILNSQSTLINLAINKNWIKPYDTPKELLKNTYSLSKHLVDQEED
ncbi:spore coat protein [Haloplasma contractile]|uniref:Spore coat protein n=1 Tax=Haloplasma contractile SSD-17B TaxID=1033810 RepID=F7Q1Z5_9MOLU|nr:spore coat protein [Haloplasma contractile]ERJ12217.1 Spore coat protein [Haloplasma contractile SSD-17B]